MNAVWGNLFFSFRFHTFICFLFVWLLFSCIGCKVHMIVGFGDFSPASFTKEVRTWENTHKEVKRLSLTLRNCGLCVREHPRNIFIFFLMVSELRKLWFFELGEWKDSVSHFCKTPTLHTPTASQFDFRLGTADDKIVWECGGFCVLFCFPSPHCFYRLLKKLKFYMKRSCPNLLEILGNMNLGMGSPLHIKGIQEDMMSGCNVQINVG